MESLKDRVAIVTGASRGIGLGIATELVRQGARVCVTARSAEPAGRGRDRARRPEVAIAVPGKSDDAGPPGGGGRPDARGLRQAGHARQQHRESTRSYGPVLDVEPGPLRRSSPSTCLPRSPGRGGRGTRGWASTAARSSMSLPSPRRPSPGIGMYGVSKAALIRLTEELAVELGPRIRVNAVAPGVVKTKFATALYEGREEQVSAAYPLKRLGVPEDVAGAVAFLLSDQAELDHRPDPGARRRRDPGQRAIAASCGSCGSCAYAATQACGAVCGSNHISPSRGLVARLAMGATLVQRRTNAPPSPMPLHLVHCRGTFDLCGRCLRWGTGRAGLPGRPWPRLSCRGLDRGSLVALGRYERPTIMEMRAGRAGPWVNCPGQAPAADAAGSG